MSNCIFEPTDYTSSCKRCGKQKFEHTIATIIDTEVAMSKQTAVEWLVEEIHKNGEEIHKNGNWIPTHMIEQAKEMEKEQIIDATIILFDESTGRAVYGLEYYNKTYGEEYDNI
jgi:hypothetical protein